MLHQAEGLLRAQECAREIRLDDGSPIARGQILERHGGAPTPALLKSRSSRPKRSRRSRRRAPRPIRWIADVAREGHTRRGLPRRPPPRAVPVGGRRDDREAAPASASAEARPMPLPAPVTSAIPVTRPSLRSARRARPRRSTRMISSKSVSASKAERERAARVEVARPAGDDPHDRLVGLAPDPRERPRHPRHDATPRSARRRSPTHRASSDNGRSPSASLSIVAACTRKLDRRPGRGEPVTHLVGHRQHRFLAVQRLANDVGEEARRRPVRLARPHADRRQANPDAVEEAATGVVREQQLADRLLRAVARQRRRRWKSSPITSGNGAPNTAIDDAKTNARPVTRAYPRERRRAGTASRPG